YDDDWWHTGDVYRAEDIDTYVADIYLTVAFLAKHCAASSLAEVMRKNIIKLSARVENQTVDKQDGSRNN
ncbi:hypothetical protein KW794_02625, partial [Candidatus Saccharibacteria bacterium]|nr:hypothetical protein [Candidatus Saccharibacteria bacterium]